MKIRKEYKNDEITVVWQPHLCIHDKSCWKQLGSVFRPTKRPWIDMDGASTTEIKNQVNKCPSGALSYISNNKTSKIMENQESNQENIQVKVIPGGPLMVTGTCEITHADGTTEVKENKTTYCRCGATANKPFCDGGHRGIAWEK